MLANPCSGVAFPVRVKGLFRPLYMSWSEQQRIQAPAPEHLRTIITIVTETSLRVFKELLSMKKDQLYPPECLRLDTRFQNPFHQLSALRALYQSLAKKEPHPAS